ncbi:TolC family protein [Olivibacter sp. XZL3]|uniref:TolC family protein n=1 Tax=Olivibacter sp. XZL3 TaxID=1735116 RepID=UPI001F0D3810|nr:TolC family protein [Olivibacter sp. XZL3]
MIQRKPAMKYFKYGSLVLFACAISLAASAQQTITIREALDQALRNNLQVKQANFQSSLSEADVLQAKMALFPSVGSTIQGAKNWGLTFDQTSGQLINTSITSAGASLTGSLVLFGGFQKVNQIKANKLQLFSNESNVDKVKNDLVLSVVTKYLEALSNKDMAIAAEQQVALSTEQLEAQKYNYEVGNNTLADLSQAKSQLATDELNLTTAQNAYDLSVLDLKQLMEMDPINEITLEKPPLPDVAKLVSSYAAQDIYKEAVARYPDIKVAEYNTLVAKKNIDIAKGGFYPVLSIGAGYGTNYSSQAVDLQTRMPISFGRQLDQNKNTNVFAQLSIPIFDNYQRNISFKKAKISYESALNDERLAKNNLNKVVNQAVLDLRTAEKRYYSTQENFKSASDAFEVLQQRYDVGLANAVELSTQQTAKNKAEFDFIQAKYDFIFRSKVIDFYLGRPITFTD